MPRRRAGARYEGSYIDINWCSFGCDRMLFCATPIGCFTIGEFDSFVTFCSDFPKCARWPQRKGQVDHTCLEPQDTSCVEPELINPVAATLVFTRTRIPALAFPYLLVTPNLHTKSINPHSLNGIVSSVSLVSTTNTARSLARFVLLALALTSWRSPGSSEKLCPAL